MTRVGVITYGGCFVLHAAGRDMLASDWDLIFVALVLLVLPVLGAIVGILLTKLERRSGKW